MKNLTRVLSVSLTAVVFLAFMVVPVNTYSQKKAEQATLAAFPDNVAPIFKNSCIGCHSDQANSKAKIFMNLSKWGNLSAKKQAKEAKAINKQISKGNMPPAGFLEKKPQSALTAEQKKTITEWANSLKIKK